MYLVPRGLSVDSVIYCDTYCYILIRKLFCVSVVLSTYAGICFCLVGMWFDSNGLFDQDTECWRSIVIFEHGEGIFEQICN